MKRILSTLAAAGILLAGLAIPAQALPSTAGLNTKAGVTRDAVAEAKMLAAANSANIVPDMKSRTTFAKSSGSQSPSAAMPIGTYPRRPGVILVTPDPYYIIPTGHAAIIWTSSSVVEALANGVVRGNNDWYASKNQAYGVTVIGTTAGQGNDASNWADAQRGKPYLWPSDDYYTGYFQTWHRDKFYCSHLVWAAFKDLFNRDLNTDFAGTAVYPMELVNTSKVT